MKRNHLILSRHLTLSLTCLLAIATLTACSKSSDELYGAGMRALHRGEAETAFDRFSAAVDADPEDVESHLELAKLYIRRPNGRERAVEHFERVIQLKPKNIEANHYLGILYYQSNHNDMALERFQTVMQEPAPEDLRKSAGSYRQKIMLASIADKNIKDLETALEENPEDLQLRIKLLKACRAVGQDYLVSRSDKTNAEIFLARYRGLRDEVLPQLREEVAANPKDASLIQQLADTLYSAGEERLWAVDLEASTNYIRQAIEVRPSEGKYHWVLAQLAEERRKDTASGITLEDVIYHLREAVRRSDNVLPYRIALARSLHEAQRNDEAIAELRRLIAEHPNAKESSIAKQAISQIEAAGTATPTPAPASN